MTYSIQPALSNQDKEFFLETEFHSARENGFLPQADSDQKVRVLFQEDLNSFLSTKKDSVVFVARTTSGKPAGLIWLANRGRQETWDLGPEPAWIYDLRVLPEYRRNELGQKLLTKGEKWATRLGYQVVGLHVFGNNIPAIALYESSGYKTNQVYLQKDLDSQNAAPTSHPVEFCPTTPESYKTHSYQKFVQVALSTGKCPPEELHKRFEEYLSQYGFHMGAHLLMDARNLGGNIKGKVWFYKNNKDLGEKEYVWVQEVLGANANTKLKLYQSIETWSAKNGAKAIRTQLHSIETDLITALLKNQFFISNLFMHKILPC